MHKMSSYDDESSKNDLFNNLRHFTVCLDYDIQLKIRTFFIRMPFLQWLRINICKDEDSLLRPFVVPKNYLMGHLDSTSTFYKCPNNLNV